GANFLSRQVIVQGHAGDAQAAVVGGVLTQGELAVQLYIVDCGETGVLVDDALGTLLKFFGVFLGPPVVQVAVSVIFTSAVIEAMGKFVPNHHPNAAIVHGIVNVIVVEGRLQNAGRKVYVVHLRVVVSVDGRRTHLPFAAINWLADF